MATAGRLRERLNSRSAEEVYEVIRSTEYFFYKLLLTKSGEGSRG